MSLNAVSSLTGADQYGLLRLVTEKEQIRLTALFILIISY